MTTEENQWDMWTEGENGRHKHREVEAMGVLGVELDKKGTTETSIAQLEVSEGFP